VAISVADADDSPPRLAHIAAGALSGAGAGRSRKAPNCRSGALFCLSFMNRKSLSFTKTLNAEVDAVLRLRIDPAQV
jgi:hypothetical protein